MLSILFQVGIFVLIQCNCVCVGWLLRGFFVCLCMELGQCASHSIPPFSSSLRFLDWGVLRDRALTNAGQSASPSTIWFARISSSLLGRYSSRTERQTIRGCWSNPEIQNKTRFDTLVNNLIAFDRSIQVIDLQKGEDHKYYNNNS